MRMKRVYRIVADNLKKKGLRATMMRPHQLVFLPTSTMGGGWLTFYKEKWHFVTWAPRLYRIPKRKDIVPLCLDFSSMERSSAALSMATIVKYNLQPLSDPEMERMFSDQEKALLLKNS